MGFFDKFKTKFERISSRKVRGVVQNSSEKAVESAEPKKESASGEERKEKAVPSPKGGVIAYRVLERPHVSEKTAELAHDGKYVFAVDSKADKRQIREAVREVYGVTPVSINVVKISGKSVRFGRFFGRQKDMKKAIVTLPEGKTLPIYE